MRVRADRAEPGGGGRLASVTGKAGTATKVVTVRLSKREGRALAKAARLKLTLLVTAKAPGRTVHSATTITVRP